GPIATWSSMGTVAFQIHDEIVRASLYKVEQYDPTPGSDDSSANVSGARSLARASRVQAELPPEQPGSRPGLSALQLSVLRRYGTEHGVVEGEVLFADGDETYDLIVVLEGEVEIIEHYGQVNEVVITAYGPGEFPGKMGLLTGQRAYLTGAVSVAGRILRIPVEQVHVIMAQELDLSELILRAFLVRHARLTRLGSGLTLVGSRFDVNTRRLLEVLSRNRLSSRWLDLEGDPEAEAFLCRLNVPVADLPIVVVPGGELLRNPTNRALLDALGLATPPADEDAAPEVCDLLVVGGGPAG